MTTYKALIKLISTILILKLLAQRFPNQFPLAFLPKPAIIGKVDGRYGNGVERAIGFFSRTEERYPSLCVRLELGYSWESTAQSILCKKHLHL